jgi:hypothetical protein
MLVFFAICTLCSPSYLCSFGFFEVGSTEPKAQHHAEFVSSHGNDNASIDDKLNKFKNNLFQQLYAKKQAAEARVASKLDEKFGD